MYKKQKVFIMFLCIFIASLLLGNSSTTYAASTTAISSTSAYLVKGETTTLKMTGTSQKAVWSSSNTKVATVTSTGKVTGVSYGSATIKAIIDKKTYSCKVIVVDYSEIYVEPSDTTIVIGGNGVTLNPGSNKYSEAVIKKLALTYKVSGNTGVKISSNGLVTATKSGKFTVTAYVHGKKIWTSSMQAEEFVGFTESEVSIDTESSKEIKFAAGFKPDYQRVEISSTDTNIAEAEVAYSVDDLEHCYGILINTGIDDGRATITVSIGGVKKQIEVITGLGVTVLPPVEAVKNNDFTGYSGNSLKTLKWVREFIDSNNLMSDTMSDREKITIIQDYFTRTYESNMDVTTYSGSISSILFNGIFAIGGNCGPYTDTVCFLCECINIDVYYCSGTADNGSGGGYIAHAWNKVKVDGTWYYIDAYWNAALKSHAYFLSETLWTDHKLYEEGHYSDTILSNYAPYKYDID
jgi:hypothetical protein